MTQLSTPLTDLSAALAAAVEKAGTSTVLVNARRRMPASGVVWSTDGAILTSDHVIERDEDITIVLADGREFPAAIVGRDAGSDLAVLRIAADGLTSAEHAPAGAARIGSFVLAIGRPSREGPMASFGVVSALGGPWRTFRGTEVEGYIRSDTTFSPGFSGGPLVDVGGRIVGINSSHLGRGAGLTIPVAAAARIADELIKQGRVRRPYLGISSQPANLPLALSAKLNGQESGLLIVQVEPGSPAETAGLGIGDILVSLRGAPITDTDSLQAAMGAERVGGSFVAGILRGGEPREVSVTLGERN